MSGTIRRHTLSNDHWAVCRWDWILWSQKTPDKQTFCLVAVENSHVWHRRQLSSMCSSVPVGTDSVTDSQDAQHNTRTLKPSGVLQPTLIWAHKKIQYACFQGRLGILLWKAQERRDANPFFSPVCVFVRLCGVSLAEGGVGQLALRQCLCWWRERGGACRILCVSSLHVRDIAERKCITGRCPSAPLPLPPLLPLSLPGLSSSFVSEHREHRGPLRQPLENTYGAVVVKAAVLPLC